VVEGAPYSLLAYHCPPHNSPHTTTIHPLFGFFRLHCILTLSIATYSDFIATESVVLLSTAAQVLEMSSYRYPPPPGVPPTSTRPSHPWDSDDSDQDVPPVTRAAPIAARTAQAARAALAASDAVGRDTGSTFRSNLTQSPNSEGTSMGRDGERENRIVVGLDYGTTATGESGCLFVSMTLNLTHGQAWHGCNNRQHLYQRLTKWIRSPPGGLWMATETELVT